MLGSIEDHTCSCLSGRRSALWRGQLNGAEGIHIRNRKGKGTLIIEAYPVKKRKSADSASLNGLLFLGAVVPSQCTRVRCAQMHPSGLQCLTNLTFRRTGANISDPKVAIT